MNKFFRFMICLVVICAMVVQISPIQAQAVSPGIFVDAATAVASSLIGLGISTGSDAIIHSELVEASVEFLKEVGYVTAAGTVALTSLGAGRYGIRSSFLQYLFDALYEYEIIYTSALRYTNDLGFQLDGGNVIFKTNKPTAPMCYTGGSYPPRIYYGVCSEEPFQWERYRGDTKVNYGSSTEGRNADGTLYYYALWNLVRADYPELEATVSTWRKVGNATGGYDQAPYFLGLGTPATEGDLTLNFVAQPGLSLAEGYPVWHANAISIPNAETGEDEDYYPLALGQTLGETQGMTQEDVWAGNGTYVDSEVVPGTGSGTVTVPDNATLKDILTGVLTIPQAISVAASNVVAAVQAIPAAIQAIPAAIADFFSVKGEVGSFTISLSDYFPFCIPFDLYAFFSCLNADPVAPVIEWAIFERDGTAHPIIIDLSAYDSVAQLLRRLQLLLFCVGLAFKTRDLIKG